MSFFLKGLMVGLAIAAPVGPIGLLCIRRSLADGRQAGFVTGLGAATADAVYGAVAGFGLTAISSFLVNQRFGLGLVGGVFLCYLGVRTFLSPPSTQTGELSKFDLISSYLSTLVLTLTNPMTIFSFLWVFAGFGLVAAADYMSAGSMVLGVFVGSALWWFLLSGAVSLFRERAGATWLRWINRVSGLIIIGFGLYSLATVLILI